MLKSLLTDTHVCHSAGFYSSHTLEEERHLSTWLSEIRFWVTDRKTGHRKAQIIETKNEFCLAWGEKQKSNS